MAREDQAPEQEGSEITGVEVLDEPGRQDHIGDAIKEFGESVPEGDEPVDDVEPIADEMELEDEDFEEPFEPEDEEFEEEPEDELEEEGDPEEEFEEDEEEEFEEEFEVVELPKALQEQGITDLEVAPEHADVMRALVNSYESRSEREMRETELQDFERQLTEEADELRMFVRTNPYGVIDRVLEPMGEDAAERHLAAWLIQDESRLGRFQDILEEVQYDDRSRDVFLREIGVEQRELRDQAQRDAQQARQARQVVKEIRTKLQDTLDQIREDDRAFVRQSLKRDIRQRAQEELSRTGSDLIDPAEVDRLARPYLDRFGRSESERDAEPDGRNGKPAKEERGGAADAARQRFQKRVKARKKAKRVKPSGSPKAAPSGPKKGAKLDDVLAGLKTGKRRIFD